MIFGSVCSGIEGASVAWNPLGWEASFFSEIEKFPCAVLAHHYPEVPCHGDFTTIKKGKYAPIDLLVGGTPCQAFSVAGLRKGFSDERGNLTLEFVRLAQRLRPRWLVWENVPGVLSIDGGRAFGSFLGGLEQCGYGFAYRILDAQYFGVPQRRRRVFVVGCLGDWRPPAAVLFERESLSGNPPPSREVGQEITGTLTARTQGGGGLGGFECMGGLTAHTLRADGFDASEDGSGRGTPLVPAISPALKSRDAKGPSSDGDGDGAPLIPVVNAIPILEAGARTGKSTDDLRCSDGIGALGDPMFTLQSSKQHAVGFSCKDHGAYNGDIAPTLRAMGHSKSHANAGGQIAVAFESRFARNGRGAPSEIVPPLKAQSGQTGKGDSAPLTFSGMAVRRLTPEECEMLQGFPRGYTKISDKTPDGPRYKALGNSFAVPVVKWIGEQIETVEKLIKKPLAKGFK